MLILSIFFKIILGILGILLLIFLISIVLTIFSGGIKFINKLFKSIRYIFYSIVGLSGIDTPLKREKAEAKRKQEEIEKITEEELRKKEKINYYKEIRKKEKALFFRENRKFFEMDIENIIVDQNVSLEDLMRENIILKKMIRHLFNQTSEMYNEFNERLWIIE